MDLKYYNAFELNIQLKRYWFNNVDCLNNIINTFPQINIQINRFFRDKTGQIWKSWTGEKRPEKWHNKRLSA